MSVDLFRTWTRLLEGLYQSIWQHQIGLLGQTKAWLKCFPDRLEEPGSILHFCAFMCVWRSQWTLAIDLWGCWPMLWDQKCQHHHVELRESYLFQGYNFWIYFKIDYYGFWGSIVKYCSIWSWVRQRYFFQNKGFLIKICWTESIYIYP